MSEPSVTVVRCRACRRSERLTLTDGRFWCAWCQRWAEVAAEQVLGAELVPDGDSFRLAPPVRPHDWTQPLRIPSGWRIELNSFAEEDIDPASDAYLGGRNLFFATNERLLQAIDVEYRAEPSLPEESGYLLQVLALVPVTPGERRSAAPLEVNWEAPLYTFETGSRVALVAELERCLRGERG